MVILLLLVAVCFLCKRKFLLYSDNWFVVRDVNVMTKIVELVLVHQTVLVEVFKLAI